MEVFQVSIKPTFLHAAIHDFRIARSHSTEDDVGEFVVLLRRGADRLLTVPDVEQHFNDRIFYRR